MSLIMVKFNDSRRTLNSLLFDTASAGDDVLLIEDGVLYTITKVDLLDELKQRGVNVYACKDDLIARGYDPAKITAPVSIVDYDGIVDLIEKNPKIIS
ncbi:sulfurtransferase complex subunit TusB [Coprothermobacter platensis]|uniref:sulfurtransferase complex subunit TusB n=1 Tax=Coprothermobacter platensis TaxID=108819 RepID=UPI0003797BCB|nr:sulfurtransferase complex subunit TusB [Coprothermobacter platensis]